MKIRWDSGLNRKRRHGSPENKLLDHSGSEMFCSEYS